MESKKQLYFYIILLMIGLIAGSYALYGLVLKMIDDPLSEFFLVYLFGIPLLAIGIIGAGILLFECMMEALK